MSPTQETKTYHSRYRVAGKAGGRTMTSEAGYMEKERTKGKFFAFQIFP
jgi:hypothetical protein